MTKHHLMDSFLTRDLCPYCLADLSENIWHSEFEMEIHYKATSCGCGKHIRLKVNFSGSGHDEWMEKSKTNNHRVTIEDKLTT